MSQPNKSENVVHAILYTSLDLMFLYHTQAALNTTSCDTAVYIVTRLPAGRPEARIPTEATHFSLPQNVQTVSGAQPACFSMGTEVLSQT